MQLPAEFRFRGSAGQTFGAFLTGGIRVVLEGEVNNYVGKGMGGGETVLPPPHGSGFASHENVIMGKTSSARAWDILEYWGLSLLRLWKVEPRSKPKTAEAPAILTPSSIEPAKV